MQPGRLLPIDSVCITVAAGLAVLWYRRRVQSATRGGGGGGGRALAGGVGGWEQDPGQVGWVGGGPNHQCKEHTKQHSRVPKL